MNKYTGILESLGVHEKAALLYLKLLDHGDLSIAEICNICQMHRMEVYRELPFLQESGLILTIPKGKRKYYCAANPYVIKELYEEKQSEYEGHIHKLVEQYSFRDNKPRVVYQEGKKGITYVFSDIVNSLSQGEVFYRISSEKDVTKANSYLPKDYRKKRDEKQLERYVIMSQSGAGEKIPRLERELVTIPPEFDEFEDDISLTVYGNKIAYIDFSNNISIIIEQANLANFQKKIFRLLFKNLSL